MEYLDVLDENGNSTGTKKLRSEVHRDGDWHRAVHVWIITPKGDLIIQKRSRNKDSHANMWDISSAGHVPAGLSGIKAAKKEVEEELGVKLKESDFEYLFTLKHKIIINNGIFINNCFCDVYLVESVKINKGNITIQKEELEDIKFIHFRELEKTIKEKDKNFVPHEEEYKGLFEILKNRY